MTRRNPKSHALEKGGLAEEVMKSPQGGANFGLSERQLFSLTDRSGSTILVGSYYTLPLIILVPLRVTAHLWRRLVAPVNISAAHGALGGNTGATIRSL